MNTEPTESIIYGSRYSAGRLSLADRWIRAMEDPDIRVVRDRFEAFVQVGSVVTVTGVAVEDGGPDTDPPAAIVASIAQVRVRPSAGRSIREIWSDALDHASAG